MIKLVRAVAGIVAGYAIMVLLITLVQEWWFGGVQFGRSSPGVLVVAGLLTSLAAALGGALATFIARPTGRAAAILMSCIVAVETTVLVVTGRVAGPLWFDLMAAASLVVAILAAAEAFVRVTTLRPPEPRIPG